MRKVISTLFILVSLTPLSASILDDFLDTSRVMELHQKQNALFEQYPQDSKYFENARFNIEHSNFDKLQRKYSVRLYTKKSGSIENEKVQYQLQREYVKQMQYWDKEKILKEHYSILVEAIRQNNAQRVLKEQIEAEQKAFKTLSSYVKSDQDILKLNTIKDKIKTLKLQHLQIQQRYKQQLLAIKYSLENQDTSISMIDHEIQNITTFDRQKLINFIITTPLTLQDNIDPTSLEKSYEITLAKQNLKRLSDKTLIGVDNLELEYDDSKKSKNALSFGISFNFPIFEDKTKLIKERLKLSQAKQEIKQRQKSLNNQLQTLKDEIEYNINYLDVLKKNQAQDSFTSSVGKIDFNTLKFLLEQKAQKIEIKKEILKTIYKIEKDYLILLYLTKNIDNQQFQALMLNRS